MHQVLSNRSPQTPSRPQMMTYTYLILSTPPQAQKALLHRPRHFHAAPSALRSLFPPATHHSRRSEQPASDTKNCAQNILD